LIADPSCLDLIDSAAELVSMPGQTASRSRVRDAGWPTAVGSVATVTTATAIVDRMADAVGWAVEVAQHVEGVIGSPVALTDVSERWAASPDRHSARRGCSASQKLNADAGT
jgi:hypothetical protein